MSLTFSQSTKTPQPDLFILFLIPFKVMPLNTLHLLKAALCTSTAAFAPSHFGLQKIGPSVHVRSQLMMESSELDGSNEVEVPVVNSIESDTVAAEKTEVSAPAVEKKVKKAPKGHPDGVFTPVVLAARKVLGDDQLLKLRAKGISVHSEVIKAFVETSTTPFGQATLAKIFDIVDANGDGTIDADEMAAAVNALGFTWLEEKQVIGIIRKADKDKNGVLDLEEFSKGAPKTLQAQLTKLAKKNGEDMGLLS